MTSPWQPYSEPLRSTLLRTIGIAVVVGALLSLSLGRGLSRWPLATLLVLWPSFGGHWVELWFLNRVRPRLSPARTVQIVARLGVWFAAGCVFLLGMSLTAHAVTGEPSPSLSRWIGGFGFIAVELIAHSGLLLRGQPSFYDGRG